ncbi:MAG: heat-inducible transcriptional repressor HrcA [Hyphomicrobiales bacterium]|nr:MAG: heat-inducible transcriptional repressor HrcA [Hyphomicrobiales bacterium]
MSTNFTPPERPRTALEELDQRSREIFKSIVDSYFETGEPLGSRNIARQLSRSASPATIRNVMSDLEQLGLIYSPHTSAGRLPTDIGLRFFVDSFMEIGNLGKHEQKVIEAKVQDASNGQTMENILVEASQMLSGLSRSAGMVITTKNDIRLKHIEFIRLEPTKALVVIVGENGSVENRVIALPPGTTASALIEASNYISAKIAGCTIAEAQAELSRLHNMARMELDSLAQKLVDEGIAIWAGSGEGEQGQLIISGHANLLENLTAADDLDRVRDLFGELESKDNFLKLLELTEEGEGVRIFIGSENKLFSMSGSAVIVAPYRDKEQRVIGAIGIIGPTRLNYARIVPMVDHTANVISKILR